MEKNISFSAGPLFLIDKIENKFNLFGILFEGLGGKAKTLKESARLFVYNKLAESTSLNRIKDVYPYELFEEIGFNKNISDRSLYRNLERIGNNFKFLMNKYQLFLKRNNLVSDKQFIDFSSSYFEGNSSELGALGYSRDSQPGKKQITFGIMTGINGIPSALTIQKGNVCDKKHFLQLFKTAKKVLEIGSLLIFDCGANTKKNKEKIIHAGFNYLTLVAKKQKTYLKHIRIFNENPKTIFTINDIEYECVKIKESNCIKYLFFGKKLKEEQLAKKEKKFQKELLRTDKLVLKIKKGKALGEAISREGKIITKGEIQKQFEIVNPFVTGVEGYFILESSVDESPVKILKLYKQRDKAEKLIRDMKEGTDLRPIRHWSKKAIIGYVLIVFFTNCLIQLTHFLSKTIVVKNLKLLKKYLCNLTVTIIHYPNRPKIKILSNISEEIREILGDLLEKYGRSSLDYWK
jgi:transposase